MALTAIIYDQFGHVLDRVSRHVNEDPQQDLTEHGFDVLFESIDRISKSAHCSDCPHFTTSADAEFLTGQQPMLNFFIGHEEQNLKTRIDSPPFPHSCG